MLQINIHFIISVPSPLSIPSLWIRIVHHTNKMAGLTVQLQ